MFCLFGVQELHQYLAALAEQCSNAPEADCPLVVILDNLHHVGSLGEIFNGLFNCNHQRWSVPTPSMTNDEASTDDESKICTSTFYDDCAFFPLTLALTLLALWAKPRPLPPTCSFITTSGNLAPPTPGSFSCEDFVFMLLIDLLSEQVGAVRQPRGAGERVPGSLPEEETNRDGDWEQVAQRGAGEDHRLDSARVATPQPLPGDSQLLGCHHR